MTFRKPWSPQVATKTLYGILKFMVPNELHALFWDTNLTIFDPAGYPDYTILRVLEYGDLPAFEWLREAFTDDEIRRVLQNERRLSPKSATFCISSRSLVCPKIFLTI